MSALFVVVPLALAISAAAVCAFVWSVRQGQLDDLETPALRMLEDERGETQKDSSGSFEQTPKSRAGFEAPFRDGNYPAAEQRSSARQSARR